MKEKLPDGYEYTNHIEHNLRITTHISEFNKANYLSKIKNRIDKTIGNKLRAKDFDKQKMEFILKDVKRWDLFKAKRIGIVDKYIEAKKKQKSAE